MRTFRLWDVILLGSVIVVACAPAPASPSAVMEAPSMPDATASAPSPIAGAMSAPETPASDAMMEADTAAAPAPGWMGIRLSNVVAGQDFYLSDFHGKVVLLEPMAVWCTKCRALQQEILKVRQELGDQAAELIVVSVDVDPNEDEQYLKAYVKQTGFDWAFAIAPADFARALADSYGDQFLNPPSTPILIIDRNGAAQALPFGPKSASDLLNVLHPLLEAGM